MTEINRITLTELMDDDGELDFHIDVSDGTEFIRAIGMLETAKLQLYDDLPEDDKDY